MDAKVMLPPMGILNSRTYDSAKLNATHTAAKVTVFVSNRRLPLSAKNASAIIPAVTNAALM